MNVNCKVSSIAFDGDNLKIVFDSTPDVDDYRKFIPGAVVRIPLEQLWGSVVEREIYNWVFRQYGDEIGRVSVPLP